METYQIYAPNSIVLQVDKGTNKIHFTDGGYKTGKYTEAYSKALIKAWQIMEEAKKKYKPNYLDPNYYTGQKSHLSEFKAIQKLYYKEPIKGAIAPWTKAEKAYYESLKTKRERYKYLVIRSGIRSSVIDIPLDAIANVDENGNLINEEYKELYEIVEANRGLAHLSDGSLAMAEWEIAAGMLGDIKGFSGGQTAGFTARTYQKDVLSIQLGNMWEKAYYGYGYFFNGKYNSPLREAQVMNLVKKVKPDKFGMYPYIDEILGVDWVMDLNMDYGIDGKRYSSDERRLYLSTLGDKIQEGKLLDPRDPRATEQTRREFMEALKFRQFMSYDFDLENDIDPKQAHMHMYSIMLDSTIMAVTPPQGYPNAPTYYIPEYLEELYREGKFDIKLDPRIPAMYRESFPEELRAKILAYAKKHNI
ncbi:hypothetical protein CQA53_11115, partial [Helicobacter didelphidarum]